MYLMTNRLPAIPLRAGEITDHISGFFTIERDSCSLKRNEMRKIEIIEHVRLRFPQRDGEFDVGVEVGAVSVLLAQGVPVIQRELSYDATNQLRPIAEKFGYLVVATYAGAETMSVTIAPRSRRPMLRVV